MKKTSQLKHLITSSQLEFLMEAHNGLSAKLAEEIGFKALWGSSLSISATFGTRDTNEASWTQILEAIEFMSDATSIPILLDGDTGYGNFNNMRRLIRKLEQRHIAGVCIEDKLFPKTNSLLDGGAQPLADIDEFCGKIKAGKEAQSDDDFVIAARVEAFIAGWGLGEALKRAEAYRKAGADAILMHSKISSSAEIDAFMKEWDNRHPVIIVPTNYYDTPTDHFRDLGVNAIIWANHAMRASISGIRGVLQRIHDDESLINVESDLVSVKEVFRLVDMQELKEAEKRYLPQQEPPCQAVILAASQGKDLGALTETIPKTLLPIHGQTILDRLITLFNEKNIRDISVVRGFNKESINPPNVQFVDNDDYATTRDLYSFYLSTNELKQDTLVCYGDIIYQPHLVDQLLSGDGDIRVLVDADIRSNPKLKDFVRCSAPYSPDFLSQSITLEETLEGQSYENAHGLWPGIVYFTKQGLSIAQEALESLRSSQDLTQLSMLDLLQECLKKTKVQAFYTKGGWIGVNDQEDFRYAEAVS